MVECKANREVAGCCRLRLRLHAESAQLRGGAMQHSTDNGSAAQHSIAQHSTDNGSAAQHSIAQHSTAQRGAARRGAALRALRNALRSSRV